MRLTSNCSMSLMLPFSLSPKLKKETKKSENLTKKGKKTPLYNYLTGPADIYKPAQL